MSSPTPARTPSALDALADSYVDAQTTSTPLQALLSVTVTALVVAVLDLLFRRSRVARTVPEAVGARP